MGGFDAMPLAMKRTAVLVFKLVLWWRVGHARRKGNNVVAVDIGSLRSSTSMRAPSISRS